MAPHEGRKPAYSDSSGGHLTRGIAQICRRDDLAAELRYCTGAWPQASQLGVARLRGEVEDQDQHVRLRYASMPPPMWRADARRCAILLPW